jgi:shikimate kinase/3-dehydroquinate synthase
MIHLRCQPTNERPSDVRIGAGALAAVPGLAQGRRVFALVDSCIADRCEAMRAGPNFAWHVLEGGEALKSLASAESVLRAMVQAQCDRRSILLAIGGGTIGDLGGFCASLFARGIELWHAPTTLLAMVDSAVGGKTALNLPEGKNLIGTIHPAAQVLIEPAFVQSEPESGYRSGLAEAIKMGLGLDADLWELLEREPERILRRDPDLLTDIVHRSLAAKIAVVEQDPHETGLRRLLNLGHTLGHALEAHDQGRTPHGLCVARGLWFALDVARELGSIREHDVLRAQSLLQRYDFARTPLPPTKALMPFLARDKKVEGSSIHFALPTGIGRSEPRALPIALLQSLLERESGR